MNEKNHSTKVESFSQGKSEKPESASDRTFDQTSKNNHGANAGNVPVGDIILSVLKDAKSPVSTYELAKKIGISWSTANTHCYKLKDAGKIDSTMVVPKIGASKKVLWFVKEGK